MAKGNDWLTEWENKQDEKLSEMPIVRFVDTQPHRIKTTVLIELRRVLSATLAEQIADRIATKLTT